MAAIVAPPLNQWLRQINDKINGTKAAIGQGVTD